MFYLYIYKEKNTFLSEFCCSVSKIDHILVIAPPYKNITAIIERHLPVFNQDKLDI